MSSVIEYDPEADILLVRLRSGKLRDERLLDNDIVLGIGERGELLYIEIWDASRRGLAKALAALADAKQEKLRQYLETVKRSLRATQSAR